MCFFWIFEITLVGLRYLLDKDSPGSWPNIFSGFKEQADFESL
ncbi:unnamed protein product, partial [marine sediment metagenome]